jgi:hypothetical protein
MSCQLLDGQEGQGTRNVEGPGILSSREREDWETCQRKRAAFLEQWTADCALPVEVIKEQRLWLRKGLRPLLSGKPDEVLRQGARALVLDHKFGNHRVDDPRDNAVLRQDCLTSIDRQTGILTRIQSRLARN